MFTFNKEKLRLEQILYVGLKAISNNSIYDILLGLNDLYI